MKIWNVDEEDILPEIGWFKLNTIILVRSLLETTQ